MERIGNSADIDTQGGEYRTALQAAMASRQTNLIKQLLNKGANINA